MPRITAPVVDFSEWVPWGDRARLRRKDGPWLGVYLWAHFRRPPRAAELPYPDLPHQLVYVGESKDLDQRPLAGRHHRLRHYVEMFPRDPNHRQLYVSVFRVQPFRAGYESKKARASYARLRVYTRYVEARLYWEYTQRWARPPALHYKKDRDDSREPWASP